MSFQVAWHQVAMQNPIQASDGISSRVRAGNMIQHTSHPALGDLGILSPKQTSNRTETLVHTFGVDIIDLKIRLLGIFFSLHRGSGVELNLSAMYLFYVLHFQ